MKTFWNLLDGKKSFSAIGILSSAAILCPLFGVPAVVTGGIVALGTILGIVGRVHAGAKLEDETANVIELKGQVEALRQYKRVP